MIRYDEVKDRIDKYSSSGEWGKILGLIDCKDSINSNIDDKLKERLFYYYSNIATDVVGINNADTFIKYYDLFNQAKTLAFKTFQNERDYLIALRSVAYFYKTVYESRLWAPKNFNGYSKEIKEKLSSDGYTSLFFRDIALYYYYLCLKKDPDDIKTNYRYAALLRRLIANARQNQSNKGSFAPVPVDYTKNLVGHLSKQTLRQYTNNFLNKNKIPIMHYFSVQDIDLHYYDKTIKLWEECTNQKEKDRTRAEYLKALYAVCRHYTDKMDKINVSLADLDYNIIEDCSEIVNSRIQYKDQRQTLSMGDSVDNKFKIIFNMLKFPSTADKLISSQFIEEKMPIQANFFYYTLAKYYIAYGVNQSSKEDDLRAALKASYFSVLANYYMSTIKNRTKSVNKWPYILFTNLLKGLELDEELDFFERKFIRIGKKDKEYLRTIREIAASFDKGKYSESKMIGIQYIKNNKVAYMDKQIIQNMIYRADAFINDPGLIKKNRDIKAKQILAKNTLTAIGFYKQL